MKEEKHLPLFGVGPIYGAVVVLLTVVGIVFSRFSFMESGRMEELGLPFLIIGIVIILLAAKLWFEGAIRSKLDENIEQNRLVVKGAYAYVRNPIYSAIMFACTGALLIANNLWLLILVAVYWLFMTLLMKGTEEKWLTDLYGQEYINYCKNVNRCIPWFPKI